ncbi:MAG: transposase [Planctomycetota bacterium]
MRCARIKADGEGYYHCMSRIIERRMILGDNEKHRLVSLMRSMAAFSGLNILAYCFMSNHFHILVHVPERREVSDDELIRRLHYIYSDWEVDMIAKQLEDHRRHEQTTAAEWLKNRYVYRMYDVSQFFKTMKQRFSQFYNAREDRSGPLWEQRFKSILVERSEDALLTMAAYIDLNPVRARMTQEPADYRYSSYGSAVGGCAEARAGLRLLMQVTLDESKMSWAEVQSAYRQRLYIQGEQKGLDPEGRPIRQGFTPEKVEEVIAAGGRLPMHDLMRCRIRYFSDGLALGRREFIETVFERYRGRFGSKRQTGARPMRYGEWSGLCTMRDLRLSPVSTG